MKDVYSIWMGLICPSWLKYVKWKLLTKQNSSDSDFSKTKLSCLIKNGTNTQFLLKPKAILFRISFFYSINPAIPNWKSLRCKNCVLLSILFVPNHVGGALKSVSSSMFDDPHLCSGDMNDFFLMWILA